jgi:hypothetical protein
VDLRSSEFEELSLLAISRFADNCRENGHVLCTSPGACERTLESAIQRVDFDSRARQFDLGSSTQPPATEPPAHTWSTAALLKVVVKQLFDEPAWSRTAHQRTVWLTSALARLGERGLPADAVVRTYFGPRIRRQIVFEVVGAWKAVAAGKIELNDIPPALRDWLTLVSEDEVTDEFIYHCLTGPLSDAVEAWIQNGALAHIIGWRHGAQIVDVAPEDRVVIGGLDATRWLIDRFTRTALDDWFRPSLDWELAYISDPRATARVVGVSPSMIAERPVSESMVTSAISRRTREPSFNDEVFGGMTRVDVMENVIALSLRDERSAALELIRKAVEVVPSDLEFEQALAFLQIPDSCLESERRFHAMRGRRGVREELLTASLAICAIRQGRTSEAVAALGELATSADSRPYLLWAPATLTDDEPELYRTSLADWSSQVMVALNP